MRRYFLLSFCVLMLGVISLRYTAGTPSRYAKIRNTVVSIRSGAVATAKTVTTDPYKVSN